MSGWGKNDFIDVSRLRTRINGLLSIIGKLKQYLGEEWQDVFQEDDEEIDAFLKAARKNPVPDANEIG